MNDKPNIILIITDQQQAGMMSCAGNEYVHTPAMDSLAESGVRFKRSYCTDPVCVPSRFSLMTGRMPLDIGLRGNYASEIDPVPENVKKQGIGWQLQEAGYETVYGGKVHLPKMSIEEAGFNYIISDERDELPGVCADYLTEERDKPFFMVASFINPHDICYMAIRDFGESDFDQLILENGEVELATLDKALQLPEGVDEKEFFAEYCPPLPDNFEIQENEPEAVEKLLEIRKFRKKARENYSEKDWRRHRWAYCKLTERVDSQIEKLLNTVKENGFMEDTVIIFTSDHGDMDSAHRLEHKTVFYEEASRVPLIVYDPESERKGIIENHLVSNGLDLLPTLCDYAGISPSGKVPGKSLKRLVQGKESESWREYVPVQNEVGYMIITGRYKYMLFEEGENREQLMDLKKDPGEMKNFAGDPDYFEVLEKHRKLFKKEWPEKYIKLALPF